MTGMEYINFKASDKKKYILKNNEEFVTYFKEMINNNIHSILLIDEMQKMMDQIVLFFEVKYPKFMFENIFGEVRNPKNERTIMANKMVELSKLLDINQLKYRLHYDMLQFLECNYRNYFYIEIKNGKLLENSSCYIGLESDGTLKYDMSQFDNFFHNIDNIKSIDQLYGLLESIDTSNINYDQVINIINEHKYKLTLRNKVLQLIPLEMIYSDPIYGYNRAKSFVRMFNKEYGLHLSLDEVEDILNRDYSQKITNEEISNIKESQKTMSKISKKVRN